MKFLSFIIHSFNNQFTRLNVIKNLTQFMKRKQGSKPLLISFASVPWTTYIHHVTLDNQSEEVDVSVARNPIQEACHQSIQTITELIERISEAIADSALQYKISLNELSTILQKYERTVEHPYMHAEIEDSIIRARAKVLDCERRYVELITVLRNVEKLIKATCELSFLMQEEDLAVTLSHLLASLLENIELDSKEITDIKENLFKLEKAVIMNTGN